MTRFPIRSRLRVIWSVLRGRWHFIDLYLMDDLK